MVQEAEKRLGAVKKKLSESYENGGKTM